LGSAIARSWFSETDNYLRTRLVQALAGPAAGKYAGALPSGTVG